MPCDGSYQSMSNAESTTTSLLYSRPQKSQVHGNLYLEASVHHKSYMNIHGTEQVNSKTKLLNNLQSTNIRTVVKFSSGQHKQNTPTPCMDNENLFGYILNMKESLGGPTCTNDQYQEAALICQR